MNMMSYSNNQFSDCQSIWFRRKRKKDYFIRLLLTLLNTVSRRNKQLIIDSQKTNERHWSLSSPTRCFILTTFQNQIKWAEANRQLQSSPEQVSSRYRWTDDSWWSEKSTIWIILFFRRKSVVQLKFNKYRRAMASEEQRKSSKGCVNFLDSLFCLLSSLAYIR